MCKNCAQRAQSTSHIQRAYSAVCLTKEREGQEKGGIKYMYMVCSQHEAERERPSQVGRCLCDDVTNENSNNNNKD